MAESIRAPSSLLVAEQTFKLYRKDAPISTIHPCAFPVVKLGRSLRGTP
jgi:hypothetical protein